MDMDSILDRDDDRQDLYQNCAENLNNVKCGEIYYEAEDNKITFHCLVCDRHFDSENNFIEHFAAHLNGILLTKEKHLNSKEINVRTSGEESFELLEENIAKKEEFIEVDAVKITLSTSSITSISSNDPIKLPAVKKSTKDNFYYCPFPDCGKSKETEQLIRIHMRNIHVLDHQPQNNGIFVCPVCDAKFSRKDNLLVHVQNIHKLLSGVNIDRSKIDSKYHCPVCDLKRAKLQSVNTHLRNQHEEYFTALLKEQQNKLIPLIKRTKRSPKICEVCGKVLSSKALLIEHIAAHNGIRPHKCIYCDKSFINKTNLKNHTRIHTSEKNYKCNYCDKKFIRSTERINHELRNHLKEKRFECPLCNKKFYTSTLLSYHNLRHTGERPYPCKICSRSFFDGTALKGHMVTHSNTKDYECDICNSRFSRKKNLVAHKQTHSNIKKYTCEECGQKFAQCAGLYSHKKTHHKELLGLSQK